jgi:hypothetical protein
VQVKHRAVIVRLGTSVRRMSSVIMAAETMILLGRSTVLEILFTIRDDKGAQVILGVAGGASLELVCAPCQKPA